MAMRSRQLTTVNTSVFGGWSGFSRLGGLPLMESLCSTFTDHPTRGTSRTVGKDIAGVRKTGDIWTLVRMS